MSFNTIFVNLLDLFYLRSPLQGTRLLNLCYVAFKFRMRAYWFGGRRGRVLVD